MSDKIDTLLAHDLIKIKQRDDMFCFSIDSMLVAFFANVSKRVTKIIDLGTGNGPIPLFLSLRTNKPIVGVEIQLPAYELAKENIEMNDLSKQITIIHDDINGISKKLGRQSFSLVVVNPPFFKCNDKNFFNDSLYKTIARHEVDINLEEIIKESYELLAHLGSLTMIHTTERLEEVISLLNKYHFVVKRIRFVHPNKNKESNTFLIDARKHGRAGGIKVLPPIYVHEENGEYTEEMKKYFHYGEKHEDTEIV